MKYEAYMANIMPQSAYTAMQKCHRGKDSSFLGWLAQGQLCFHVGRCWIGERFVVLKRIFLSDSAPRDDMIARLQTGLQGVVGTSQNITPLSHMRIR